MQDSGENRWVEKAAKRLPPALPSSLCLSFSPISINLTKFPSYSHIFLMFSLSPFSLFFPFHFFLFVPFSFFFTFFHTCSIFFSPFFSTHVSNPFHRFFGQDDASLCDILASFVLDEEPPTHRMLRRTRPTCFRALSEREIVFLCSLFLRIFSRKTRTST